MSTHVPASYTATIPAQTVSALEIMTYEFRVVEHLDENDKVTKYVMQMQIWSHKPSTADSSYSNPRLVRDWYDVPRVRMKNGVEQPAPARGTLINSLPAGATGTSNNYIS
jgi:hypothetical protein